MDYTKFIDSVVGNIARKIEDEFNESDHPRDKGGKFTTKGGEGKGGAKEEASASGKNDLASKVLKKVGLDNNLKRDKFDKHEDKIYEFLNNTVGIHWYSGDAQYDEYVRGLKEAAEQFPKETEQLLKEIESGEGKGGKKEELVPETETEKAAKEELKGSTKADEEYLTQIDEVMSDVEGADLPLASLMEDLGIDTEGIPDEYLKQDFEERLMGDKKLLQRTKEYVSNYRKGGVLESNSKTDKLVSAALEGLMDDTDTAIDFLKGMKGSIEGLEDEDGDIDMNELGSRIERAIRKNPEDAAEMLGQLGDIYYEEEDVEDARKGGLGRNPLKGLKKGKKSKRGKGGIWSLIKRTGR